MTMSPKPDLTLKLVWQDMNHPVRGHQRVYRLGDYGLSIVNGRMLHSYSFYSEAAVIRFSGESDVRWEIDYSTPLSDDVEVFATVQQEQEFRDKAEAWMAERERTKKREEEGR